MTKEEVVARLLQSLAADLDHGAVEVVGFSQKIGTREGHNGIWVTREPDGTKTLTLSVRKVDPK